ncbi:hypothetical protein [Micavibrio aeruginosavorus]|uniref:Uncharacterized protein n=1 Tax=Micavibrio aeruginosavorus EPB TaxID=349215 RepID=M4VGE4_9BACT|nr:hypothetical protein [Micavibrio aeruginosavorus]AGH97535.1 hypothetical protein A11S_711 [Micavibrio aeruginosavorus EPB]
MPIPSDLAEQICHSVARQVRDHDRTVHLVFLAHRNGQRLEALSSASQELLTHPAGEAAIRMLKTGQDDERSAFLGLGTWRESLFGGLASQDNILALATFNMDEIDNAHAARALAWHLAWFALRMAALRNNPDYETDFRGGILLPDPNDTTNPATCMRADVFSSIMGCIDGDKNAIEQLAHDRAMAALQRRPGATPEQYPFPLAKDATEYAYAEMVRRPPPRKKQIDTAMKIAEQIGLTYDGVSLNQWIYFCQPAQDMAWRGEPRDIILSAAVNTSHDTFIRATGFLVSELTRIQPASIHAIHDIHSPFAEDKYNQRLHERMVDRVIHDVIEIGMGSRNSTAFRDAANRQNEGLIDGHIAGWCAAALQAAGRAFEAALASGSKTPDEAARREFEGTRHKTAWESLRTIGENIMEKYRQGHIVTFSDILDFCEDTPALASISSAVAVTIKDPTYVRKLQAANDLNIIPDDARPAPSLAPRTPTPATPAMAPSAPGMGRGTTVSARTPPTPPPIQRQEDETTITE